MCQWIIKLLDDKSDIIFATDKESAIKWANYLWGYYVINVILLFDEKWINDVRYLIINQDNRLQLR